jgi:hypothetical protein
MDTVEKETERMIEICSRLKRAKESLEIGGVCPEVEMNHENDPYNIGFIWASLRNALHSATDSLKSIVVCKEPGNLQEIIEKSDITK